ncbi:MAG: septum formation protein Maf [Candidatus Caenarcaniphilales bacterium]|nr:septum formation protein Maf [Candidatus Caenarcaniphilales bacterium]
MTILLKSELILASASKTRLEMLARHGLNINNHPADIDEEELKTTKCSQMSAEEMALFLAKEKALDVSRKFPDAYIIAADQVCLLDGKVYDKPGSIENCIQHLKELRSKTHTQNCAMLLVKNSEVILESLSKAEITLRDLTDDEIKAYVNLEEPLHSAGSYMLERHGKHIFKEVRGDHDVILGLDTVKLFNKLYELDIISLTTQ